MNKDEILNSIIQLEADIKNNKSRQDSLLDECSRTKKIQDEQQKVYDEIKAQLNAVGEVLKEAAQTYRESQESLRSSERQTRTYQDELAKLRRELSRAEDAERLHAEYLAEVESFREKCLSASWRKENRSDGIGALEHQIDGAIHLAVAKQGFLGDKRGLGKSLTSLIYADLMDAQKVIVICPSDTMDNFIREIKLWTPHRLVMKLGKMSRAERDFVLGPLKAVPQFVLVLNYEAWRRDSELIQDLINLKADTLIYDEAHKAKTWTTSTCQGVQDLRFGLNQCPSCRPDDPHWLPESNMIEVRGKWDEDRNYARCDYCGYEGLITEFCSIKNVLPMTGTPILNKPQELFPHLRVIDPTHFIDEKTFLRDFCTKGHDGRWRWQWGAEDKLVKRIGPRYIARDRKAAGIIIPPAQPIEHIISKDEFKENYPKQYKAYEQVRQYAQLVLDPDQGIAMAMPYMIVVLMRLRQCLTWPAGIVLKRTDPETKIEYEVARLNVFESVKLDKAEEILKEVVEEGDAALSFSMFKDPMHELQRRLGKRALAYTGDTADYLKNEAQLDFDPKTAPVNPKWDVLLGTYGAMGVGLNLNRATHEVMLDRAWNPGGEDQAEGRIDRIGTTKNTYIHRIMVEGTVDTWMKNLIDTKADLIAGFSNQADMYQEVYRALRDGEI